MKIFKSFLILSLLGLIVISCKDDDNDAKIDDNEEVELITTVVYSLTDPENNTVSFTFADKDGDGGEAPKVDVSGNLKANTVYTGKLTFSDESGAEVDDKTSEIAVVEADEHQIFFTNTSNNVSVAYSDKDENGNPIGIKSILTTTSASKEKITITLLHKPNKSAEGVKEGDITNAGGEPDIEVSFDFNVEAVAL